MWLTAVHIPGRDNVITDRESRIFHDNIEWMLRDDIFQKCIKHFSVKVEMDLFASRLNKKLKNYRSWKLDPGALHVDAFKVSWSDFKCYGFAPFSLIDRVLQKLLAYKAEGIFILPHWPTQPWFPPSDKSVYAMPGQVTRCHRSPDLTICPRQNPSIISKTTTNSLSLVREVYQWSGLSNSAVSIIMNSWRASTRKQYQVYYNKWIHYCDSNYLDIHSVSVNQVLEFLTFLFQKESSYSALKTARSALSSIVTLTDTNYTVSNHPVIKKFMKGSFNSFSPSVHMHLKYLSCFKIS